MASNSRLLVGEVDVKRALGNAGRRAAISFMLAPSNPRSMNTLRAAIEDLATLRGILVGDEMKRAGRGCNHWFIFSGKISTKDTLGKGLSAYGPMDGIYLDRNRSVNANFGDDAARQAAFGFARNVTL